MRRAPISLYILASSVLAFGGCISLLGPEDLRFRLSLANGVGIDRQFAVGVDGLTLRTAAALSDFDLPIQDIHWVDFGSYHIRGEAHGMVSNASLPGYQPMVRVRSGADEVTLLAKQNDDALKSMVVLVRESDELIVVRVRGQIDALLGKFMELADLDLPWADDSPQAPDPEQDPHDPRFD